ncbi:sodium-dependent glucose transporter 1-like [Branchiostoma floridae x Branchiostoma japonicum]
MAAAESPEVSVSDRISLEARKMPGVSSLIQKVKNLPKQARDYRVIRTASLSLAWFCMGLYFRIVGPTMIDLKDRIGVDYEEISRVLVSHTVGYFLATVTCGIFLDFQPKYAYGVLGSAFFLAGVGTAGTPFTTSLGGLGFLQHLAGWGHGFTDAAGTVVCARLWGDKASAPMHAMHAGYPIGAFIIPLIVIPFLSPDRPAAVNGTTPPPLTVEEAWRLSKIQWPYIGVSVAQFIMCTLFVFYQYKEFLSDDSSKTNKAPKSFSAFLSPGRFMKGKGKKAIFLLVLLFLYYALLQLNQNAFTQYMVSYMVETNMFSKPDASVVYSTFWISYASMRWVSIAAAAWVPVHIMLSVEITGVFISGIVLAVWGATNKTVFWVFTCILGLSVAPIFPGGTAWANQYLDASSIVFAICVVGASVGGTASNYLTGYLFEYVGPRSMLYFFMGCGCALLPTFVVMQITVSSRFATKPSAHQDVELETRHNKGFEMGDAECKT